MADLIIEIGTEELPASYIGPALSFLKEAISGHLAEARLACSSVVTQGTPRRLVLMVQGLSERQADVTSEVLGPRAEQAFLPDGTLTPAALGFLSAKGLSASDARRKATPKGDVLAAEVTQKGLSAEAILTKMLPTLIARVPFPKTMRWEASGALFARPVRWIVAVLGDKTLSFEFADVKSSNLSCGHRFLAPDAFVVTGIDQYRAELGARYVELDTQKRREIIASKAKALAHQAGARLIEDEALLDTVANLIEYPWPVLGHFDASFLDVPREILISEMREHQKYFALEDSSGQLVESFVIVAGSKPTDPMALAQGNARVLRARFEDGAFYYRTDLEKPLEQMNEQLKKVLFQRGLGSVWDKVQRIEAIVGYLGQALRMDQATIADAKRAAHLCKADLQSGVVSEFPHLQGVMGRRYALFAKETEQVASAIEQHYWPRFAQDQLPSSDVAALVALADRLDTLCGVIGIGKIPKGNADPFGLRRMAIGWVRILMARSYRLSLADAVQFAMGLLEGELEGTKEQVMQFVQTRARGQLMEDLGSKHATALIDGAMAAGADDVCDLWARIEALWQLQQSAPEAFLQLAATFKRAGNIVQKALSEGQFDKSRPADMALLVHPSELRLQKEIDRLQDKFLAPSGDLKNHYLMTLEAIAQLKPFVDQFFNDVMVMDDNLAVRGARLSLLHRLSQSVMALADFSRLQMADG